MTTYGCSYSREIRDLTFTSQLKLDKDNKMKFHRRGVDGSEKHSLLQLTTADPNIETHLKYFRGSPYGICLSINYISWIAETNAYNLVVEKLRAENVDGVRRPYTLSSNLSGTLLMGLFTHVLPTQKMFSLKFKKFIRKTIKVIEEEAKRGVYIRVAPPDIFITTSNDLKLFDLRSRCSEIGASYQSLYSTIQRVVVLAEEAWTQDSISAEVRDLVNNANIPMSIHMLWHPSLLLPEGKLDFYKRMWDAYVSGFLYIANPESESFSWTAVFKRYQVLSELLTKVAYVDDVFDLLRAIGNMKKHLNKTVFSVGLQHVSPIDNHTGTYTDTEKELIIDKLFPLLAKEIYGIFISNEQQLVNHFEPPELEDF